MTELREVREMQELQEMQEMEGETIEAVKCWSSGVVDAASCHMPY